MKILFAVMGCEPHVANGLHQSIRDTWATDVPILGDFRFFLGRGETVLHPDSVRLDVPDNMDGLLEKSVGILAWALDHQYDAILKVTTDTYVNIPLLEREDFLVDYAGAPVGKLGEPYGPANVCGFLQGSALWLSSVAASVVVHDVIPTMQRLLPEAKKFDGLICPYPHSEDLWIAQALTPYLKSMRVNPDNRYANGPLTFHFDNAKSSVHDWMRKLHDARPDERKMWAIHESR
jgi:hypothetical protein